MDIAIRTVTGVYVKSRTWQIYEWVCMWYVDVLNVYVCIWILGMRLYVIYYCGWVKPLFMNVIEFDVKIYTRIYSLCMYFSIFNRCICMCTSVLTCANVWYPSSTREYITRQAKLIMDKLPNTLWEIKSLFSHRMDDIRQYAAKNPINCEWEDGMP